MLGTRGNGRSEDPNSQPFRNREWVEGVEQKSNSRPLAFFWQPAGSLALEFRFIAWLFRMEKGVDNYLLEVELASEKTILIVDDVRSVLNLVKTIVETLNHKTLLASSPREALRIAEQSSGLDALITDIRMPEITGFELARFVRRGRPGLPILFISGHFEPSEDEHLEWLREPNVAFLAKPFSPSSLLQNLDGILIPSFSK